jgi:hypothetical protein
MGLFGTRWVANYKGHEIAVARNEWTKGFAIEWDGEEIARRRWSFIGLGELDATAEIDGRDVDVQVRLDWSGKLSELDGDCIVTVDGERVPTKQVK